MQILALFTTLALAASTLAANGSALSITNPTSSSHVQVGNPFTIQWTGDYIGKVDVGLIGGHTPSTLDLCGNITNGIDNVGSVQWDVSEYKPIDGSKWDCSSAWNNQSSIFGVQIVTEDGIVHYSPPFTIQR